MSLSTCTEVFGEALLIAANPDVTEADCVYQPFNSSVFFDRDPSWGVYSLDGRLIPTAAYTRGMNDDLVGQSNSMRFDPNDFETVEEEHIYFGPLIPHYGHFVVTSLARAWYLNNTASKRKILCHSDQPTSAHFSNSYMREAIGALNLEHSSFRVPKAATRFKHLTIPGRAFVEQKLAHSAFLTSMHEIGDALLSSYLDDRHHYPVYLSKSRLPHGSVACITNEIEVEARLSDRGVRIVHPESLSLTEQIQLFATCQTVLGFAGSAFHTHVFVREPPRMFVCTLDDHVNSNFIILDKLNNAKTEYLHPVEGMREEEAIGFSVARSIRDVPRFVDDLLELIGDTDCGHRNGGKIPTQTSNKADSMYDDFCVHDHQGDHYIKVLARLHLELEPETYLEIGTLHGETLSLASCTSIAIDPEFQIKDDVLGRKAACLMFQNTSDEFFAHYDPTVLLGGETIAFAFLDGMHRCEYLLRDFMNVERHCASNAVVALHDCLPVEIPMTSRVQEDICPMASHRAGWWTGDVWRTVLALKKYRPDLDVICLDASPTGLVLVSKLNSSSKVLEKAYDTVVEDMMSMDLEQLTVKSFLAEVGLMATSRFAKTGSYREYFLKSASVGKVSSMPAALS